MFKLNRSEDLVIILDKRCTLPYSLTRSLKCTKLPIRAYFFSEDGRNGRSMRIEGWRLENGLGRVQLNTIINV